MTDDTPLTAEQLLQATSRQVPPEAALEAETAALRESFLQLGGALEAAGAADFDEAALIATLTSKGVAVGRAANHSRVAREAEAVVGCAAHSHAAMWPPVLLATALAAAALVAIVRTVAFGPQAPMATSAPAERALAADSSAGEQWPAAWSDPLDDEIAAARVAVDRIETRAADLDGSLDEIGSRLQSLAAELESGSL